VQVARNEKYKNKIYEQSQLPAPKKYMIFLRVARQNSRPGSIAIGRIKQPAAAQFA
jgi:hypothetical protein